MTRELYSPEGFIGRVYQLLDDEGQVVAEVIFNDYITDVGWLVLRRVNGKQERVAKFGRKDNALAFLRKHEEIWVWHSPAGIDKEEKRRTFPKVDKGRGWRG